MVPLVRHVVSDRCFVAQQGVMDWEFPHLFLEFLNKGMVSPPCKELLVTKTNITLDRYYTLL